MTRTALASPYLEWAKLQSAAPWNLADERRAPRDARRHRRLARTRCRWPARMPTATLRCSNASPRTTDVRPVAGRHRHRLLDGELPGAGGAGRTGRRGADRAAHVRAAAPGRRRTSAPSVTRFDRRPPDGFGLDADAVDCRHHAAHARRRAGESAQPVEPAGPEPGTLRADRRRRRPRRCAGDGRARSISTRSSTDPPGSCVHLGPAFVSTSSLTKVYGLSALRCGWVIADAGLVHRIWRLNDLYGNVQPFVMDCARRGGVRPSAGSCRAVTCPARRSITPRSRRGRPDASDLAFTMPAWGTTICAPADARRRRTAVRRAAYASTRCRSCPVDSSSSPTTCASRCAPRRQRSPKVCADGARAGLGLAPRAGAKSIAGGGVAALARRWHGLITAMAEASWPSISARATDALTNRLAQCAGSAIARSE